jgi:hypothetical protein
VCRVPLDPGDTLTIEENNVRMLAGEFIVSPADR